MKQFGVVSIVNLNCQLLVLLCGVVHLSHQTNLHFLSVVLFAGYHV